MNRKDFLYSLCAPVFGAVGITLLSKTGYAREANSDSFLAGSIDLDSAARVGQAYIKQGGPERKEIQKIANQLHEKFALMDKSNYKKKLQALNFRIRNDFSNGKTVFFDNWVLSQTEVAFCVFAYHHKR